MTSEFLKNKGDSPRKNDPVREKIYQRTSVHQKPLTPKKKSFKPGQINHNPFHFNLHNIPRIWLAGFAASLGAYLNPVR